MFSPQFLPADPVADRAVLLSLNIEYVSWVFVGIAREFGIEQREIVGQSVPDYVAGLIDQLCAERPPRGAYYLVKLGDEIVGMGGIRCIRPGLAEVKRVYVRPAHRGKQLGDAILRRLVADAGSFGYHTLRLDSGPFMTAAHRLYAAHGFAECAAYPDAEVPKAFHHRWRFMQRSLVDAGVRP